MRNERSMKRLLIIATIALFAIVSGILDPFFRLVAGLGMEQTKTPISAESTQVEEAEEKKTTSESDSGVVEFQIQPKVGFANLKE